MLDIPLVIAATVLLYLALDAALGYAISRRLLMLEGEPHEVIESNIVLSRFVEQVREDPTVAALEIALYNSFAVYIIAATPLILRIFNVESLIADIVVVAVQAFLTIQLIVRRAVLGLFAKAFSASRRLLMPEAVIELAMGIAIGLLLVYKTA